MIYLPDTNSFSAYMRGDNPQLVQKMQQVLEELCLSVIVLAEREFGVAKGPSAHARIKLAELAEMLPLAPFTREDSTHYAAIRSDSRREAPALVRWTHWLRPRPNAWERS